LPAFAQLSDDDKRDAILYLEKYSLQVEAERLLRETMKSREELAGRERYLASRELATAQKETELALKRADEERRRAEEFKLLYERASKRQGGVGCFFRRLIFKPCKA
jgi:hypothetical protein